ncbi:MAG: cohesin domain-containing protein [Pyrinomonadaceae bacterium]
MKYLKLLLAVIIFSSLFAIGCSQSDKAAETPANANSTQPATASTTSNSTVDPAVNAVASDANSANKYVVPPASGNSNTAAAPANPNAPTATIRARNTKATAGREVTVELELDSKEDITVMVFSLDFDPKVFTYMSSKISPGTPQSAVLSVNAEQTAEGRFGAMLDAAAAFAGSKKPIMTVVFRVAAETAAGDYQIAFGTKPARQSTSNIKTQLVDTKFEPATIRVTAAR